MLALINYGLGNRRSVEMAFTHVGAKVQLTDDPKLISQAQGIVIPGVGAFPKGMSNLQKLGLDTVIKERSEAKVPILGICLGMQLLFDSSVELEPAQGLGLIAGEVKKLDSAGEKLPHIGWNQLTFTKESKLRNNLPEKVAFYHVHSYVVQPVDNVAVLGVAEYGTQFVSAVEQDNIFGLQFHPEKSSQAGLQLLKNFVAICEGN